MIPPLPKPCNFCKARSLPCAPRLSRIHCNNPDCLSTSCSRLDEELFSRVKTMRPALEREKFDTVLGNIRIEGAQSTPSTLRIHRFPTREMPPYPSPISSSTTPASDEEEDPSMLHLHAIAVSDLMLSHTWRVHQQSSIFQHLNLPQICANSVRKIRHCYSVRDYSFQLLTPSQVNQLMTKSWTIALMSLCVFKHVCLSFKQSFMRYFKGSIFARINATRGRTTSYAAKTCRRNKYAISFKRLFD